MYSSANGSFVEAEDGNSEQLDPLLAAVFSRVQLPPVRNDKLHENTPQDERDAVLEELDQVLKTQRSLSESSDETPVPPPHNHVHVPPPRSRGVSVLSEHGREHHITPALDVALEHTNGIAPTLSERSESLDSEDADVFPADGVIQKDIAALRYIQPVMRSRSQTVDSQVSTAESRFGTFDLQDDTGRYRGSQINLYHDEVAYIRPKSRKMTAENDRAQVVKTPSIKRGARRRSSRRRVAFTISRPCVRRPTA
ncbi:G domain-containing protein [Aphelenchoides fujianensis]|nr:G domain-containing protein [Aphelenchoides fujianensis]